MVRRGSAGAMYVSVEEEAWIGVLSVEVEGGGGNCQCGCAVKFGVGLGWMREGKL